MNIKYISQFRIYIFLGILSLMMLSFLNTSCVPAVIVGAGALTGGIVVYDKRDLATIRDDQSLRFNVYKALRRDGNFKKSHIGVATFNRVILLTGEVPQASLRYRAERITKQLGAKKVYNEITIEHPTSAFTRTNDSWITAKIKAEMLGTRNLSSGAIKVATENSNVFLMGLVSHEQADIAVDIARRTMGVKRVITVFDYQNM